MESVQIGVVGGSGLYNMPELRVVEELHLTTPFGKPSDAILIGTLEGQRVAFIARHGRGHVYMPSEVPYRANIYALKMLGVQQVISVNACGSLREEIAPGHLVVPHQLVDWTRDNRGRTFFGEGLVAHVSVADPFCQDLSNGLAAAVTTAGGTVHRGGTFIVSEGPRFATRAESALYRSWGYDIIGMTTAPEAFLAREAEMCYAVMAHVTDYDVWHDSAADVSVEIVLQTIQANVRVAQRALIHLVRRLADGAVDCACHHALENTFISDPDIVPAETIARLGPIVEKYFDTGR